MARVNKKVELEGSGAKVFVHPEQHDRLPSAVAAMGLELKPRHIIVAAHLVDSVDDVIGRNFV